MCTGTGGVTTYHALRSSGHSRRDIERALAAGAVARLRRGVYATEGACKQVCDAARHGGALTCCSGARHHGLWVLDEDVGIPHVWLHAGGHWHTHPGCRCVGHWQDDGGARGPGRSVRRGDGQPLWHPHACNAFGVADVPHILLHLLHCTGLESFFVTLESALHAGKITRAEKVWLHRRVSAPAQEAIAFARHDAESGLESLVRWRLRGTGLRVRTQVNIMAVGRVDFLIGDRLIVEVDGRLNHDGTADRHKDRMRDANAAAWGYITLRFDYAQVVHDWPLVLEAIRAQVEAGNHLRR